MCAAFWVLLYTISMYDWKQPEQRLKLRKRPLTIKIRNLIRWKIYRDNNFHPRRKISIESEVSLKILTHVYNLARSTQGKHIAQSFLFTTKIITKYSSERFLSSICVDKMFKRLLKFKFLYKTWYSGQVIVSNLTNVHKLAA